MTGIQCYNCINVGHIFQGKTQRERNEIAGAIQAAVRKYGCKDYFKGYYL